MTPLYRHITLKTAPAKYLMGFPGDTRFHIAELYFDDKIEYGVNRQGKDALKDKNLLDNVFDALSSVSKHDAEYRSLILNEQQYVAAKHLTEQELSGIEVALDEGTMHVIYSHHDTDSIIEIANVRLYKEKFKPITESHLYNFFVVGNSIVMDMSQLTGPKELPAKSHIVLSFATG